MSNACYNPFIYGLLNVSTFVDITYAKQGGVVAVIGW
jgi:hypothetical protein